MKTGSIISGRQSSFRVEGSAREAARVGACGVSGARGVSGTPAWKAELGTTNVHMTVMMDAAALMAGFLPDSAAAQLN
jgi:hypothetical protein